jgi:hypothetical protein
VREEFFTMAIKRTISEDKNTVTIEFTSGQTFGPFRFDGTTDMLTRMIGDLDARVARLEAQARSG